MCPGGTASFSYPLLARRDALRIFRGLPGLGKVPPLHSRFPPGSSSHAREISAKQPAGMAYPSLRSKHLRESIAVSMKPHPERQGTRRFLVCSVSWRRIYLGSLKLMVTCV
jgi:hypothetical protein